MRKIQKLLLLLSVFFLTTLNLLPVTPAYATGATLSLDPSTATINPGCNFSVDIKLDTGGISTDGTDAILFYDPARLTATSIKNGTIYSEYPGNNIDVTQGKITVSGLSSVASAYAGSGTLATIDFVVKSDTQTGALQMNFDFDPNEKAKTTDSNVVERGTVADILNQVVDGNFTIGTGTSCADGSTTKPTLPPGKGGPDDVINPTPTGTKKQLDNAGVITPTVIMATVGTLLTLLGAFGVAIKR